MSASSPCLRDYRDKLTPGTVLGLSFEIYDYGYEVTRALPIQQFRVFATTDTHVVFAKSDGHHQHLTWDCPLQFLRFGPGPYRQAENILPPSPSSSVPSAGEQAYVHYCTHMLDPGPHPVWADLAPKYQQAWHRFARFMAGIFGATHPKP